MTQIDLLYSLEDKQNPIEREAFKQKLSEYLRINKQTPELLQVWFWDESRFSLRVIRRKTWGKKRRRKKNHRLKEKRQSKSHGWVEIS